MFCLCVLKLVVTQAGLQTESHGWIKVLNKKGIEFGLEGSCVKLQMCLREKGKQGSITWKCIARKKSLKT